MHCVKYWLKINQNWLETVFFGYCFSNSVWLKNKHELKLKQENLIKNRILLNVEINTEFLSLTLDTVKNHIVVLDAKFDIIFANKSWVAFGKGNGFSSDYDWIGVNYKKAIEQSAATGDEFAIMALKGIRSVRLKETAEFEMEYPCHSPTEDRWFAMQINSFDLNHKNYYVVSHQNITKRVQLEFELKKLARIDSLTNLANRRAFDDFLASEWLHCKRSGFPISLAIIDVDNFKEINDTHGHMQGDECLKKVSEILLRYCGRASDLCARLGGDEFAVIWGDVSQQQAFTLVKHIHDELNDVSIMCQGIKVVQGLEVSIGVNTITPSKLSNTQDFLDSTDKLMYQAKKGGKNKIQSNH